MNRAKNRLPLRIALYSDLHLEHATFEPPALDADIVVLAGDIGPKLRGLRFAEQLAEEHEVLYVLGNHEYYGTHTALPAKLKGLASPRVHVLDDDEFVFRGVRFLGCTFWTDLALVEDQDMALATASRSMNDYRYIRNADRGYKRLQPMSTMNMHHGSRMWLQNKLRDGFAGPTVVITHHAPSAHSLAEPDRSAPIAACYASAHDALVKESGAALWIHGHTHRNVDYQIGATRILTNQRGHAEDAVPGFDLSGKVLTLA